MKQYKITVHFENLDNSLYTGEGAAVVFNVESDDLYHAHLLGEHLQKTLKADCYSLDEYETKI